MKQIIFLLLVIHTFVFTASSNDNERILDYHSKIQVLNDGDIHVTETITVNVENYRIRHGIYRSTPTIYFGVFFSHKNSNITILKTKLDGIEVPNHQKNLLNGIRVYLGSEDKIVSKGIHSYEIEYIASQQVLDFEDSNGVYWNVTGTDWSFPIDKASADIYLPTNSHSKFLTYDTWTGYLGSKDKNVKTSIHEGHIRFETTKNLQTLQGLTVRATWPIGLITQPKNKSWFFIKNNIFWFVSIIMLLLYPLYFYRSWKQVGIDPPKGSIFPQYYPPKGVSPAAVRFIRKKIYETKSFSVAIMNLAVKRYIKIEQITKKSFLLTKIKGNTKGDLSAGEELIFGKLFKNKKTIKINKTYNGTIDRANRSLKRCLLNEHKDLCYQDNFKHWFFGIGFSLLVLLCHWIHFFNWSGYAQSLLFVAGLIIIGSAFGLYHTKSVFLKYFSIILPIFVTIVIFSDEFERVDTAYRVIIVFIILLNALFYHLIQAPTVFGRKTLDNIEGFKMYLATAEQDRLDLMHPPELTPQLFEKYLPYALALGVENKWSEQFHGAMKNTGQIESNYQPNWFVTSNHSHFNIDTVTTAIGSKLASTVASASTVPSSSSSGGSSSGGGFSGGGGGGGGGGGW